MIAVYALIVFELVHRALAAALGGIAVVVALHIVGDGPDLGTVVTWIDEETLGLLIGMMVIVDVLAKTGLFEWAAVQAYALSGGSVWRLSFILCTITAVFSAFLDNVTTILLIVPVTIQISKVLDLEPIPPMNRRGDVLKYRRCGYSDRRSTKHNYRSAIVRTGLVGK